VHLSEVYSVYIFMDVESLNLIVQDTLKTAMQYKLTIGGNKRRDRS